MEKTIQNNIPTMSGPDSTATHSGWMQFNAAFAKYRDECIQLGRNVLGNNLNLAIASLSDYHSSLYSMAQQVFSFYSTESKVEDELTNAWLDLGDEVNSFLVLVKDRDFRNQMALDGDITLNRELKVKLLKYFNKIDRMAAEAGLQVGHQSRDATEPKKGLVGFRK